MLQNSHHVHVCFRTTPQCDRWPENPDCSSDGRRQWWLTVNAVLNHITWMWRDAVVHCKISVIASPFGPMKMCPRLPGSFYTEMQSASPNKVRGPTTCTCTLYNTRIGFTVL